MDVCGLVDILEIFIVREPDRLKQAAVKDEFSGHKYQRRTGRDDPLLGLTLSLPLTLTLTQRRRAGRGSAGWRRSLWCSEECLI